MKRDRDASKVEGADTRRTRHAAEVASPQELAHALAPK